MTSNGQSPASVQPCLAVKNYHQYYCWSSIKSRAFNGLGQYCATELCSHISVIFRLDVRVISKHD